MSISRRSFRGAIACAAAVATACSGSDGHAGKDAVDTLVATVAELPGANCAYGGTRIDTGLDANRDGVLAPSEVSGTEYVCRAGFPSVERVAPAPGDAEIPVDIAFHVVFTTRVDPATVDAASVTLTDEDGQGVDAAITYDDGTRTATLVPSGALVMGRTYVLAVSAAVRDLSGAILFPTFEASYLVNVDRRAPAIVAIWPPDGGMGPAGTTVGVTFDEALAPGSAAGARLQVLTSAGDPVDGTVSYDASRAALTFKPASAFALGTRLAASVSLVAADALGNWARVERSWTFEIASAELIGAPTLSATAAHPGDRITFALPMNPVTAEVEVYLGNDLASPQSRIQGVGVFGPDGAGLVTGTFTVPSGFAAGTYSLFLLPHDSAGEHRWLYAWRSDVDAVHLARLDYTNASWTASALPLPLLELTPAPAGPNLVVSVDGVTPGNAPGTVDVAWTVRNAGDLEAGASVLGLFRGGPPPATFWTPDAWIDVPVLAPGAAASGVTTLLGAKTIWALADLVDEVAESNEGDDLVSYALAPRAMAANGTAMAIPDNGWGVGNVVNSTVQAAGVDAVLGVTVKVSITHPFDADLVLELVSPSGTVVRLAKDVGVGGDDFSGTVFDDDASVPIASGVAPFSGSYRPAHPLSSLTGEPGTGTWTLWVGDDAAVDVGTLTGWTLMLW